MRRTHISTSKIYHLLFSIIVHYSPFLSSSSSSSSSFFPLSLLLPSFLPSFTQSLFLPPSFFSPLKEIVNALHDQGVRIQEHALVVLHQIEHVDLGEGHAQLWSLQQLEVQGIVAL